MIDTAQQVEQLIDDGSFEAARVLLHEETPSISNTRRARLVAQLTDAVHESDKLQLERDRLYHVSAHPTD